MSCLCKITCKKNVIILGKLFSRNISSPKFENVKAKHTIKATFKKIEEVEKNLHSIDNAHEQLSALKTEIMQTIPI